MEMEHGIKVVMEWCPFELGEPVFLSARACNARVRYIPNKWTIPAEGAGSLGVFNTLQDALLFAIKGDLLFYCDYYPSHHHLFYEKRPSPCGSLSEGHLSPMDTRFATPMGTRFASMVRITSKVYEEEV